MPLQGSKTKSSVCFTTPCCLTPNRTAVSPQVDAHVTAARVRALRSEGEEALASVQAAGKAAAQASGDTAAEAKAKLGLAKVLQAKGEPWIEYLAIEKLPKTP